MKTLKCIILGIFTLITFASCATRAQVRVAPNATVVTKVHNPKVVIHKRNTYYVSNGIWYKKKQRKYVVVNAPSGAIIANLPRSYKVVKVRGKRYYKCNGVFYKKSGKKYMVVRV